MRETNLRQIIKSTSIIAGAQVIQIIFGVIRTKIIAVLLGPVGVGIAGLYQSVMQLITTVFSFGISQSSVKSIAEFEFIDKGKQNRLINSSIILVSVLGILAAVATIIFARPISQYTFNTPEYSIEVTILSISIILNMIVANLTAVAQGLRQLKQIALINIYSSVAGLLITVPVYYLLGIRGIVLALILLSISNLIITLLIIKSKIQFRLPATSDFKKDSLEMMKLGIALAFSGFLIAASNYFIRIYVTDMQGIEGVGYLNAANAITTVYLSLIFTAMGTDFYPKIASMNNDNNLINNAVNDQMLIGVIIAGPIIISFISFPGLIIQVLYSSKFSLATELLKWQLFGTLIKAFSWPIGFIILAKGLSRIFIITELFFNISYYFLILLIWKYFHLTSIGISYFISYILLTLLLLIIVNVKSGFAVSKPVFKVMSVFLILVVGVIYIPEISENEIIKIALNIALILFGLIYSFNYLRKIINIREVLIKLKLKLFQKR
jgi:O-antigen/teichoic acid export membrane protein